MYSSLLYVTTLTQAVNGRNFLSSVNIKGKIEKVSGGTGGCAYAIRIFSDPDRASRLLGTIGINVLKIERSGVAL